MQHGALAREPRGPREAIDKKREKKAASCSLALLMLFLAVVYALWSSGASFGSWLVSFRGPLFRLLSKGYHPSPFFDSPFVLSLALALALSRSLHRPSHLLTPISQPHEPLKNELSLSPSLSLSMYLATGLPRWPPSSSYSCSPPPAFRVA